jgi:WD40 repeat protein
MVPPGSSIALAGSGLAAIGLAQDLALVSAEGDIVFASGARLATGLSLASVCAAPDGQSLVLGTEDGCLMQAAAQGDVRLLARLGRRWIEHVAAVPAARLIGASIGKQLHLLKADGSLIAEKEHESSLTGIAFDARGKRCAVSHYNGASLHWTSGQGSAQRLDWKGSHTGIAFAPDAAFVVTAMQENALHGWTLPGAKHMRMAGYPAKTRAMAWTARGRYLATSGAPSLICWPFTAKDGPMGKAPLELPGPGALVTRVAAHPKQDIVAAGFDDGMIVLFRLDTLDSLVLAKPGGSAISGLCLSTDGAMIGYVCEDGSGSWTALPGA